MEVKTQLASYIIAIAQVLCEIFMMFHVYNTARALSLYWISCSYDYRVDFPGRLVVTKDNRTINVIDNLMYDRDRSICQTVTNCKFYAPSAWHHIATYVGGVLGPDMFGGACVAGILYIVIRCCLAVILSLLLFYMCIIYM